MMDHFEAAWRPSADQLSRFELAPPRHFVLPAILLLLSEEPAHGYGLVKELAEFRFGPIDRPSVYRALALLGGDGLVESWSATPTAGQARRVYGLTALGERVLRAWMGVIKEERNGLDAVLRRYQATGTVDAALAEIEGGWAGFLGPPWSSVSSTSPRGRDPKRTAPLRLAPTARVGGEGADGDCRSDRIGIDSSVSRFLVVPDRSVILLEARSTVGPINFGAVGLTGRVDADVRNGEVHAGTQPVAHLEVSVDALRSGNALYDAELLRRIDARRFPVVSIDLRESTVVGAGDRFRLAGVVTFHGVTRQVEGTVTVSLVSERRLVVAGEQVFDIRDFDIASPTVLMLRIYPDVRVRLHLEAELTN